MSQNDISKVQIDYVPIYTEKGYFSRNESVCLTLIGVQKKDNETYRKVKLKPETEGKQESVNVITAGALKNHEYSGNDHYYNIVCPQNFNSIIPQNGFVVYSIWLSGASVAPIFFNRKVKAIDIKPLSTTDFQGCYLVCEIWSKSKDKAMILTISKGVSFLTKDGFQRWVLPDVADFSDATGNIRFYFVTNTTGLNIGDTNSNYWDVAGERRGRVNVQLYQDNTLDTADRLYYPDGSGNSAVSVYFRICEDGFLSKHIEDNSIHFSGEEKQVIKNITATETETTISAGTEPNKAEMILGGDGSLVVRAGGEEKDVLAAYDTINGHIRSGEEHIYNDIRTTDDMSEAGCHDTLMMRISPSSFGVLNQDGIRKIAVKAAESQTVGVTSYLWVQGNNGVIHGKSNDSYTIEDGWYVWEFDTALNLSQETSYIAFHFRKDLTTPLGNWPDSSNTSSMNIVYDSHGTSSGVQPDRLWFWKKDDPTSFSYSTFRPKVRIITDGYAKRHIDNSGIHFDDLQEKEIVIAHAGDESKHITADEKESLKRINSDDEVFSITAGNNEEVVDNQFSTLTIQKDGLLQIEKSVVEEGEDGEIYVISQGYNILTDEKVDEEPTENSLNVASSGGIWKSNEYLNGEEIFEEWVETSSTEPTGAYNNSVSLFSYKPLNGSLFGGTKVQKIEMTINATTVSEEVKLVVFGVSGTSGTRYDVANLVFLGLSKNSVDVSVTNTHGFEFEPFGGNYDELLFALIKGSTTLFDDNLPHRMGVSSSNLVSDEEKILIPLQILVSKDEEVTNNYKIWPSPWTTETMGGNVAIACGVPLKFRTVPHKYNTDIHLSTEQVQKIDNALTSSDITDVLRTTDVVDIVENSENPVKSGAVYTHTSNTSLHFTGTEKIDLVTAKNHAGESDPHFDNTLAKTDVISHIGDSTKHLSEAQTTTLTNLDGATGIDTEVSEGSTNLVQSGAVYDATHNISTSSIVGEISKINDEPHDGFMSTTWVRINAAAHGSLYMKENVVKVRIRCGEGATIPDEKSWLVIQGTVGEVSQNRVSKGVYTVKNGWLEWEFNHENFVGMTEQDQWLALLFQNQNGITNPQWGINSVSTPCAYVFGGTGSGLTSDKFNGGGAYMPIVEIEQGTGLVQSTSIISMVSLTQTQYDALATKDPNTFYIITEG